MIETIKGFLLAESSAIQHAANLIDETFIQAVDIIHQSTGKTIVTGVGKSGHIGNKISSTLASTGTPSVFLHPTEGLHGDLGMIQAGDIILALAYSGETDELAKLYPAFKRQGIPIILITGRPHSSLAQASTIVLNIHVKEEVCPINCAPTSSAIVSLAFGDAIALTLMKKRGFTQEDFAYFHPGGALGKRLLTKVKDIMHPERELPKVYHSSRMEDVIVAMSGPNFGIVGVFDEREHLMGAISDGDLRRAFKKHGGQAMDLYAKDFMSENPKIITANSLAAQALHLMEKHKITVIFVSETEGSSHVVGLLHMHDLLQHQIL